MHGTHEWPLQSLPTDAWLQKWREHNASARVAKRVGSHRPTSARTDAAGAVEAWAGISRKARSALRKLDIHRVHTLEEHVVSFAASVRSLTCAVHAIPTPPGSLCSAAGKAMNAPGGRRACLHGTCLGWCVGVV